MASIQHHTHRALAHFQGILVRRLAHGASPASGVEAFGKPSAAQWPGEFIAAQAAIT
jgi:hypothetical protein